MSTKQCCLQVTATKAVLPRAARSPAAKVLPFASHFALGQVQRVSLFLIMAKVFIDPIIQRLEKQQQSLPSTKILGTSTTTQNCTGKRNLKALGRYIYWQVSPNVKGQKHVLHFHKDKIGPNTLCFGIEPSVLSARQYACSSQPAGSKNLPH